MREDWESKKLGDVCYIIGGGTPSKSYQSYYGGNIPWATVRDLKSDWLSKTEYSITVDAVKKSSTNIIPKGNLVIATRVGLGKGCLLKQDTAINQDLKGIIPIKMDELYITYLFYWFKSIAHKIVEHGTGATVQGVKLDYIKKILVPIPPLEEQQQIVALLDQAFEAIDQAKANIEKNIANAQELFQSKLNEVFSQQGEGWEEKSLGEVAKYDKSRYTGNDRPYLGLEDIESNSGMFLGNLSPCDVKSSTFQFDERHVLYGRLRPYLNKVLVPTFKGHCSTEIFPILPSNEVDREYLFYWFLAPITVLKIDATWTGARMPRANMNEVINFKLPIPSLDIQKRVSSDLTILKLNLDNITSQYEEQILNIDELKKSILQKAFAGELTANTIKEPA